MEIVLISTFNPIQIPQLDVPSMVKFECLVKLGETCKNAHFRELSPVRRSRGLVPAFSTVWTKKRNKGERSPLVPFGRISPQIYMVTVNSLLNFKPFHQIVKLIGHGR
jgi:hypothetical protein